MKKNKHFDGYAAINKHSGSSAEAFFAPTQAGIKADNSKPDLSLLPAEYLIEAAKALTFGAKKYNAHNFRKGILTSRLLAAAQRHLTLEINGVPTDSESGLSHLSHALASLAMYAFMKNNKPELDDRYKPSEKEINSLNELMYNIDTVQNKK